MAESGPKEVIIEGLSSKHDRPSFFCGDDALDQFLRTEANQAQKKNLSRTFVLVQREATAPVRILGYYTLSIHEIEWNIIPIAFAKALPRYPIPAIHIARLAVARDFQGRGFGSVLLADAVKRAVEISDNVGVNLIDVIAKDPALQSWYENRGFTPIPDSDELHHLMMSMKVAKTAVEAAAAARRAEEDKP